MNTLTIILIIVIIIIIIFINFHINDYNKVANDVEILQIEDISKDYLENICRKNQPIIIHKFPILFKYNFNSNENVYIQDHYLKPTKKETMLLKDFYLDYGNHKLCLIEKKEDGYIYLEHLKMLNNYHSPLSYKVINSISIINKYLNRDPTSSNISRNIYICLEGECNFRLYHPSNKIISEKNQHSIYITSNYSESHKHFDSLKYVEVILRKGQGMIIPRFWFFNYRTDTKCILLNSKSFDCIGLITDVFKFN